MTGGPPVARYDGDPAEWDRFVRSRPEWTPFHLWGWKGVMERVFGHECTYLAACGPEGNLAGVLPLVRMKSALFGHFVMSMPFLNYGGPLGETGAVRALVSYATSAARESGATLLELRNRYEAAIDLPVSHRKITVLLNLPERDAAPLWDGLKAKVRSQVRRPRKEGVTVAIGPDQVEPFYRVFARHMRDLGTPVMPRRWFDAIAERFGDMVWFGCAYLGGRPVAGGCGFRWGDEFEMTWASALREYNRIAPNMLLYWSMMERCVAEGVRVFNFGRCTLGGRTHRFKRQWGSRDEPLWWYQDARVGAAAASTPSPDAGAYAWGPKIWRRLPLAVANVIGPRIVRFIP